MDIATLTLSPEAYDAHMLRGVIAATTPRCERTGSRDRRKPRCDPGHDVLGDRQTPLPCRTAMARGPRRCPLNGFLAHPIA